MSQGDHRNEDGELDASALESEPPKPRAASLGPRPPLPPPTSSAKSLAPKAPPAKPMPPKPRGVSVRPPPPIAPRPGLRVPTPTEAHTPRPPEVRRLSQTPRAPEVQRLSQTPRPPEVKRLPETPRPPEVRRVPEPAADAGPSPWQTPIERLGREIDARAEREPTTSALLLSVQARIYLDALGDPLAATNALARAATLAPDARFVASTWRWVTEQSGEPLAVLERARAELAYVGEGRERLSLLWQIAAIEEHVTNDATAAMRTLRELIALDPNDLGAWDALGALFLRARAGDSRAWNDDALSDETAFGGLALALDHIAQATEDPVVRSAFQGAVGTLRDRYLGKSDEAVASLRRALESDATNAGAQATLEAILLRNRHWDEYARVIAALADRTAEPFAARELYERAGDVYAECVRDHAHAAHCYVRAATLAESDPGPVEKLIRVLETAGRWDDAAAAYERLLTRVREPAQKAWALVRLGGLHESHLGRPSDALAAYRLAVDAAPTFAPAVQALLALCRVRKLPLAIELERREVDRVADPNVRAVRNAALAELIADQSPADLSDEAALLYERALALDPTNAAAFEALDRMYRGASQWTRLIALYEAALGRATHPRRARSLRLQLAELLQSRAREPGRASDLRREALAGPDDRYDTLVSLGRSLADAGRWAEHVEVLEAQASMLDGEDEIAAIYRIGAALETRVQDLRRALATYEIVLDRAPTHLAAARAVARIHERENRWERVIEAERRLLDLASRNDDVVEGLLRIAQIFEEHLGRVDEAIAAYLEALARAPAHAGVIAALERLLRGVGDYVRLAQVLQHCAETTPEPIAKARARLRAATVLELCLGDPAGAEVAYVRALSDVAGYEDFADAERSAALWGLLRMQEVRGEWDAVDESLALILQMTTEPALCKRVLVRRARNAELRRSDIAGAARFYDEAIASGAAPAAMAVDQLRVARIEGHRETIADRLARLAESTTDARLEGGLLRVLALATEYSGMGTRALQDAASLYERLSGGPLDDVQALDGLVRCVISQPSPPPNDARLAHALIARARATAEPVQRALLAFAAGVIDETTFHDDEAEVAYSFALLADPEFVPALDAARRLRTAANEWPLVASLSERWARASVDLENAAEAWLEAAHVYEKRLNDPSRALACHRSLLAGQPGHGPALERALLLFELAGDFGGAAAALQAHIEALVDPSAQARMLSRRATILASRIGDTAGAIVDLRRAMALVPHEEDVKTIQALALLEERMKNWQEALQLYDRIASAPSDADARSGPSITTRRRARLAQARIFADELRDDVRGKEILEALVAERPDDRDATLRLADISARSGHEARALELYDFLSQSGTATDRVRALVALSDVHLGRPDAGSKIAGEAALARAFDLAIADPSMITPLQDRLARDGDYRSFIAHAEAAVSRVRPHTAGVLPMRTAMARVLREEMGNPEGADRQLAAAIQAFPDSMETRLALASGLVARNPEAALAELRRAVNADPIAAGPYETLVTLLQRLGRPELAAFIATAASLLGSTSPDVENAFLKATPLRPIQDSFLYDEAMSRFVGPTRARLLRSVLFHLDPFLHKIFPGAEAVLESRARLPDTYPITSDVRGAAQALGAAMPIVCRGSGRDVALTLTEQRAIVIGGDLLNDNGRALAAFHGAYICSRLAASGSLYVAPRLQAIAAIESATQPDSDNATVREFKRRIGSALPRKTRKELERIGVETPFDVQAEFAAWETEESRRALYSAIHLSRDLRAVAQALAPEAMAMKRFEERREALAASPTLREVLVFAVSGPCWDVFQRIFGRG